jgi:hypothetical protein
VQIPWIQLRAPIRVLSDGDDVAALAGAEPRTEAADGGQTATDTIGGVQLGSVEIDAPVAVASDSGDPGGAAGPANETTTPATPIDGGGGTTPTVPDGGDGSGGQSPPGSTTPADDVSPDNTAIDPLATVRSVAAPTTELDGGLPFTGLGALVLALTGLLFLLAGRGLLIIGSPRGPRRPRTA